MLQLTLLQIAIPNLAAIWLLAGQTSTQADLSLKLVAAWLPCGGVVDASEEGRADIPARFRHRRHLEGSFARLRCGPYVVLLDGRFLVRNMVVTGRRTR